MVEEKGVVSRDCFTVVESGCGIESKGEWNSLPWEALDALHAGRESCSRDTVPKNNHASLTRDGF